ncbi:MAG: phosphate ABC transporter permease PstA [Fibrobacterota bacterium]
MNKRNVQKTVFFFIGLTVIFVTAILALLIGFIVINGYSVISWEFLTAFPENGMMEGGIFPAIAGTFLLSLLSMAMAVPLGVGAAIYLKEYAGDNKLTRLIRLATNNLAGVPSVVFGLFGLSLFVKTFNFGVSLLSGSLTLMLIALPVVIRATEEALATVPRDLRLASLALGATKLQTITNVVLPASAPGIITGVIICMGRVAGETAPILFTSAAYFLPRLPGSIFDQIMALPYHLYFIATEGTHIEKTRPIAYGTALVLLMLVLLMNSVAIYYRNKIRNKHFSH